MIFKRRTNISVVIVSSLLLAGLTYADVPDRYQNSGSNNISYDLPSKFYAGINLGYSALTDNTVTIAGNSTRLNSDGFAWGFFGGYKFNDYISIEANALRLGELKDKGSSSAFPLAYNASLYQLSLDGILSYPIHAGYQYTLSVYGKAGYGVNITDYHYNANNGAVTKSGNSIRGAYNVGLGLNVDLRSNISARIGYTYYQTHYPLPGCGSNHGAHVVSLGLYYNFS
ncbi:MAG: outer membrane beta-barrel protein [Coxiellaceae bacterium]|nr:outer membrane beta-barrel protein [Coxiellaceae bacterium]